MHKQKGPAVIFHWIDIVCELCNEMQNRFSPDWWHRVALMKRWRRRQSPSMAANRRQTAALPKQAHANEKEKQTSIYYILINAFAIQHRKRWFLAESCTLFCVGGEAIGGADTAAFSPTRCSHSKHCWQWPWLSRHFKTSDFNSFPFCIIMDRRCTCNWAPFRGRACERKRRKQKWFDISASWNALSFQCVRVQSWLLSQSRRMPPQKKRGQANHFLYPLCVCPFFTFFVFVLSAIALGRLCSFWFCAAV